MPVKPLPANPSLEHLKYQARDLLKALSQGNTEAITRAREFHPEYARSSTGESSAPKPALADALLIIAREYGFDSWPKLKHHIEELERGPATIAGPVDSFEPPIGSVDLKQKWPVGARIVKETDLKQKMEINHPGKVKPDKKALSIVFQYAYTVVNELSAGGREVQLEHLGFQVEVDSGGHIWRYDSDRDPLVDEDSVADESEIARALKTILRSKIRYRLDANNQIQQIAGVDELMYVLNAYQGAKLKPGRDWDNDELDKVVKRIQSGMRRPLLDSSWGLKNMFNEHYFKTKLDPGFFPGKTVQPGDVWNFSRELRENKRNFTSSNIFRDCKVTFQSLDVRADRLCARLEFQGVQKTLPPDADENVKIPKPVIEGTYSGVAWFDPEQGRGIEANATHDFKVTSNKLAKTALITKPPIQTVTDHHHQVITDKLVSVTQFGGVS